MTQSFTEIAAAAVDCARYGEVDEVKQLLAEGCPFDAATETGSSALHYAAANGHLAVVEALLAHKPTEASPDILNSEGNTPLHWASLNGHTAVAELLLNSGADPEKQNKNNKSPVYEAIIKEHKETLDALLKVVEKRNAGAVPDGDANDDDDEEEECVILGDGDQSAMAK